VRAGVLDSYARLRLRSLNDPYKNPKPQGTPRFARQSRDTSPRRFYRLCAHYYLAGIFQAPLRNRLIHIHGAGFTCWIRLLIRQTSLVSADRVDIHRRLGLFGFALACSMPVLAILAAIDEMVRHAGRANVLAFFAVPTFDILAFVPLIFFAWKYRSNAAAHKRLIILAPSPFSTRRLRAGPFTLPGGASTPRSGATEAFLLPLIAYDLFSIRKIHRATFWGSLWFLLLHHIRGPVGHTYAWQTFAAWVQHAAR
jgi:hypothetical protein